MTAAASTGGVLSATAPGAGLQTLPFSDTFTRSDGDPGKPWYSPRCFSELTIVSDTLRSSAADGAQSQSGLWIDQDNFDLTFDVQFSASSTTVRDDMQVALRRAADWGEAESYLWATQPNMSAPGGGSHGMTLYKMTRAGGGAASYTQVASRDNSDILAGNSYTFRIKLAGSMVHFYRNGALYLTATVDSLPGQRGLTFVASRPTSYIDNVSLNAVSGAYATQQVAASSLSSMTTISYNIPVSSNTAAGNTLIAALRSGFGIQPVSISDTGGNTWHIDAVSAATGCVVAVARGYLTTALTTSDHITVTLAATNSGQAVAWQVLEYVGIPSTTTVDVSTTTRGASTTSGSIGPSAAVAHAGEVAVSALALSGSVSDRPTVSSPWESEGEPAYSSAAGSAVLSDQLPASGATLSATWSWTTSLNWGLALVSYTT